MTSAMTELLIAEFQTIDALFPVIQERRDVLV
jgi:hypothetical protein